MRADAIARTEVATMTLQYPSGLDLSEVVRHVADELDAWPDRAFVGLKIKKPGFAFWIVDAKWEAHGASAVRYDDGVVRCNRCGTALDPDAPEGWCDRCERPALIDDDDIAEVA
jgi:hypothetical protein